MSDNERRIKIFEKWAELDDKKEALHGIKVARMLDGFKVTYYAVNKNYHDLLSALNGYESNPKFLDDKEVTKRSLFFNDLSRLILNYLSSTYSLLQQAEKSTRKGKFEKAKDYYSVKKRCLQSNACFSFCMCLRHIAQHFEQIVLMEHFSREGIEVGKPPKQNITLRKKELLLQDTLYPQIEREGFENYINSSKNIDLKCAIEEYQKLINNFYQGFADKMRELYISDLQEYEAVNEEIHKLREQLN
jgi:hypothetical protein